MNRQEYEQAIRHLELAQSQLDCKFAGGNLTELKEAWSEFSRAENNLDDLIQSATSEGREVIRLGQASDFHGPCD